MILPAANSMQRSNDYKMMTENNLSLRHAEKELDRSKSSLHRQVKKYEKSKKKFQKTCEEFLIPDQNSDEIFNFLISPSGRYLMNMLDTSALTELSISGVGSTTLRRFYERCGLNLFMSTSESSLKKREKKVIEYINEYGLIEGKRLSELSAKLGKINVSLSLDETWNGIYMFLRVIDSITGFTILDCTSDRRTFESWINSLDNETFIKLEQLCILSMTTDEAPALKALASFFNTPRFPDLFHICLEVSKVLSLPLSKKLNAAKEKFEQTEKKLKEMKNKDFTKCFLNPELGKPYTEEEIKKIEKELESADIIYKNMLNIQERFDKIKKQLSGSYQLTLENGKGIRSGEKIVSQMQGRLKKLKKIGLELEVSEQKLDKHLGKASRAIENITPAVNMINNRLDENLKKHDFSEEHQRIIKNELIPACYLKKLSKSSKKTSKEKKALQEKSSFLLKKSSDLLGEKYDLALKLSQEVSDSFQRSSSPLEGQNAVLAKSFWSKRRMSKELLSASRYKRDFFDKDKDGKTKAEKFYGHAPKSLITYISDRLKFDIPEARINFH